MAQPQPLQRYEYVTGAWVGQAFSRDLPGVRVSGVRRGPIFGFKLNKFHIGVDNADGEACSSTFIVKGNFSGEDDPQTDTAWAYGRCAIWSRWSPRRKGRAGTISTSPTRRRTS